MVTDEGDHGLAASLPGLVLEFRQSLLKKPVEDLSKEAHETPAADLEAEVQSAMAALQRVRSEGSSLEVRLARSRDEVDRLQQSNVQLQTSAHDAKRELIAASTALTAERERGTLLEEKFRSASARVQSLEQWTATLRGHLDALISSIRKDLPGYAQVVLRCK